MRDYKEYTIFSSKAATGQGNVISCDDFTHAIVSVDTASSANLTTKIAGSIQDPAPDFTAAQTATNSFDYIQLKDLEDASSIDGDTGFAVAGTDDHRLFEININALRYFTAVVTTYTAGNITIKVRLYNNK